MTILGNVADKLNSFFGIRGDGEGSAEVNDVRSPTHASNGAQTGLCCSRSSAPSPPHTANAMLSKPSHADPNTLPSCPWAQTPSPPPRIDGSIDLTSSTEIYEDGLPDVSQSRLQHSSAKQRLVEQHAHRPRATHQAGRTRAGAYT